MTKPFSRAELSLLKELASEFALANPALAPLLDGSKTDPDVERLIESALFENSLISLRLEVTFPELIHKLAELMLPHYLRPIPVTTIIGFTTRATRGESASIPAGTKVASAPVNGTSCRFATTQDLELHPLELVDASFAELPGRAGEIRLSLTLKGLPLSRWRPKSVRLFLADDHAFASELFLLLSRHVIRITLAPVSGGASFALPASCLTPSGFADSEALLPYPPHAFPGYRLLQEYFSTPEKFFFFELSGLERWQERGDGMQFSVSFELDSLPSQPKRVRRESFALHAVPAVNLFPLGADPISVDHGAGLYPIRPAGSGRPHCFSVDGVTGYRRKYF
jgi:type VI secretion system protein ImpG